MGNEGKPRPLPLPHEDMNQPFQTVQFTPTIPHTLYISFFKLCKISWLHMSERSRTNKGTRSSRLRTGHPRQRPGEGETAQYARVDDTP